MKIITGFNEKVLREICKKSGMSQTVKDLNYVLFVQHWQPEKELYAERIENIACIFGYYNAKEKALRISGTAVDKECQGNGYGKILLKRAIQAARIKGMQKVKTRSLLGVNFYVRYGKMAIVGHKDGDFLLELQL